VSPELSVCVITWNSRDKLADCLAAVPEACAPESFEVVLVDNGSSDGTVTMVEERFPDARLIRNSGNRGVSRARNQALGAAKGEFLLILDDDTIPKPGSLSGLAESLRARPDVGIVGPRLEGPGGKLQLSCRRFHNGLTPFMRRLSFLRLVESSRALRAYLLADWDHATWREVDHVIGACQAFSRCTYELLGPLDERMFYGWEDTDYCVRARRAGLRVLYSPEQVVVHAERRVTRSQPFGRNTLEFVKSMLIFFCKYPGGLLGRY
jgi:GT2 family glycosyltransferase